MNEHADIAIIGAGAAGLMAAIWAGRTARSLHTPCRIVVLDGAKHLGAKILVAGGGRCNVTHDVVDETAYAGSSRNAIRKVLRSFDVQRTIEFFREIGVELKREETGKLFPVTDDARTVLEALLGEAQRLGVTLRHPWRVASIRFGDERFIIESGTHTDVIMASRVLLATGGKSLPKSGSDGAGYKIAESFGHTITSRVFPALVPLTLPIDHPLCSLSGVSAVATLHVRSSSGKRIASFTDSTLCTHFGLSGPGPLDISRYLIDARGGDSAPAPQLCINWLPAETPETFDRSLIDISRSKSAISSGRALRERDLPSRLAETLCTLAGVNPSAALSDLTREQRRSLVAVATDMHVPVTGDRGFAHAEVTAGGVPLSELKLDSMESRVRAGLHIIGEICDVDGRIGGYNFQWAWSSGYIAGCASIVA